MAWPSHLVYKDQRRTGVQPSLNDHGHAALDNQTNRYSRTTLDNQNDNGRTVSTNWNGYNAAVFDFQNSNAQEKLHSQLPRQADLPSAHQDDYYQGPDELEIPQRFLFDDELEQFLADAARSGSSDWPSQDRPLPEELSQQQRPRRGMSAQSQGLADTIYSASNQEMNESFFHLRNYQQGRGAVNANQYPTALVYARDGTMYTLAGAATTSSESRLPAAHFLQQPHQGYPGAPGQIIGRSESRKPGRLPSGSGQELPDVMRFTTPSTTPILIESQDRLVVTPSGAKRRHSTMETPPAFLAQPKRKRAKMNIEELAKVKIPADAAQAFAGTLIVHSALQVTPAYVNEATSIQGAKLRLSRASGTIQYHDLKIVADDHATYTHQTLMPKVFQRFFDAILKKPGDPPAYITAEQQGDFIKKHDDRYQLCCGLISTQEQQLDAIAAFELLVAAAKHLSTHGIPIADLRADEYAKPDGKQRIMTQSKLLVDQTSTFLQRLDRLVELRESCAWFAHDILKGLNTSDIVAAPKAYAKLKFTAFNSNNGRDSRRKNSKQAKALLAKMRDEGNGSASNGTP